MIEGKFKIGDYINFDNQINGTIIEIGKNGILKIEKDNIEVWVSSNYATLLKRNNINVWNENERLKKELNKYKDAWEELKSFIFYKHALNIKNESIHKIDDFRQNLEQKYNLDKES